MSSSSQLPVLASVDAVRAWRQRQVGRSIGFVPTMGALHDGHIDLVRKSLSQNNTTVLSIFVNPAQFAPHEDYGTYPKTFDTDMARFRQVLSEFSPYPDAVVFLPSVKDMYPSGIVQNVADQKGTFIEVKGYSHQMEGQTRPTFFRGVATIVTKLFNVVEPTRAYFGQKDIQQALILRRLTQDLLISHPLPSNLIVVPTHRDSDGLALSSRNAYLTPTERQYATTLFNALKVVENAWSSGSSREAAVEEATSFVAKRAAEASQATTGTAELRLDYIALTDPETFEPIAEIDVSSRSTRPVILSGALFVGKTRLIDNFILGDVNAVLGGP
ncbi:pantothenate synthetase [Clavulina sp. PMI_390]|nr:pantothenate synthetase [Clavulina sp. PMI_390]